MNSQRRVSLGDVATISIYVVTGFEVLRWVFLLWYLAESKQKPADPVIQINPPELVQPYSEPPPVEFVAPEPYPEEWVAPRAQVPQRKTI